MRRLQASLRSVFALGLLFLTSIRTVWADAAIGELITLRSNGPPDLRLNLVVIAEGYQDFERNRFLRDAQVVVDGILRTEPISFYQAHFNAFAVFVASAESGSDHPAEGISRDTYFNSTYDSYGIRRLITIPPNNRDRDSSKGMGKVYSLLADLVPDYDLMALVVNDSEYGGSGGPVLVVSTHEDSAEIAIHELGHTFAHLGDEYSDAYPGFPDIEEPNTTRETVRTRIKWNQWIDPTTSVPTPLEGFGSVIGLFQGAHYHSSGWYRPKANCKMRTLDVPFCAVCAETLVLGIHQRIPQPSALSPPATDPVIVSIFEDQGFRLDVMPAVHESVSVVWKLNGVTLANPPEPAELRLTGGSLPLATNDLSASLLLSTPLVRNDPLQLLQPHIRWTVVKDASAQPRLTVERFGSEVEISWSEAATEFILESSASVVAPSWTRVDQVAQLSAGRYRVRIGQGNAAIFYRLNRP